MSDVHNLGHRFAVGFLTLCCGLGLLNVIYGLGLRSGQGLLFAGAQAIFSFFAGAAAWNVHQWKPIGRVLAIFVILQWVSALTHWRGNIEIVTVVLTVPLVIMYLWLRKPDVKARFKAQNSPI
jgi:hypothetical protein